MSIDVLLRLKLKRPYSTVEKTIVPRQRSEMKSKKKTSLEPSDCTLWDMICSTFGSRIRWSNLDVNVVDYRSLLFSMVNGRFSSRCFDAMKVPASMIVRDIATYTFDLSIPCRSTKQGCYASNFTSGGAVGDELESSRTQRINHIG